MITAAVLRYTSSVSRWYLGYKLFLRNAKLHYVDKSTVSGHLDITNIRGKYLNLQVSDLTFERWVSLEICSHGRWWLWPRRTEILWWVSGRVWSQTPASWIDLPGSRLPSETLLTTSRGAAVLSLPADGALGQRQASLETCNKPAFQSVDHK